MSGVEVNRAVPLVVDVDGTLIKTDLLHESTLQFVARNPFEVWRLAVWLIGGKARLKARLADRIVPSADSIQLRDETIAIIRKAQEAGQAVYLASASDRRWVEPIAERVGGITGVFASDGQVNLAGTAKAAVLTQAFGRENFDYIGDNRVDMAVWAAARCQLLVAHGPAFELAVKRRFPNVETIVRSRPSLRAHVRALRTHQWAKNALVFLPVIAGHSFMEPRVLLATVAAFFAFSLAASSAYVINDLLDLPGDRSHPRKRHRPFAAGDLPISRGIVMAVVLMAGAVLLAAVLPLRFITILVTYVLLTLGYSIYFKRKLLIDVIVLGGLYTLRVFGGVAASDERTSQWLLMFSLFLFLSLATVKRCSELVARRDAGEGAPIGRGYLNDDLNVLYPLGAAAGYSAVLVVTLYLASPEVAALYTHPTRMWLVCPVLLYWISRVLVLSNRNQMHDDPVIFALTDKVSWLTALAAATIIAVSI